MAGSVFRPPLLKKAGRTPQPQCVARSVVRIGRHAMIERRDHCMSVVAQLRNDARASGVLANKVRQLLTRHWAASSWRSRADLLRTAEWLVGIVRKSAEADSSIAVDAGQFSHVRARSRNPRETIGEQLR
jgi:hypothetical protein